MSGKYLIFGQARSGTTTIAACLTRKDGDMIQEPTCIRSGDCYLIKDEISNLDFTDNLPVDFYFNNADFIDHNPLDKALEERANTYDYLDSLYCRFDGIKHVWNNNSYITNLNIINYVKEKNIPVLFLYRNNLFDVEASFHIAKASGVSQLSIEGNTPADIERVKNKVESCDVSEIHAARCFTEVTRSAYYLNSYWGELKNHNCKIISYEDFYINDDKKNNLIKVCEFLNIDFNTLNLSVIENRLLNKDVKQSSEEVTAKIENMARFKEIQSIHTRLSNFHLE